MPRRLARLTVWPCWSVSWKGLAGKFSGADEPEMASARIGSAFGLAWAAAIGAAPRMISPTAPAAATDPMLAVATDRRTEAGRIRSRQPAAGRPGLAGAGSAPASCSRGGRAWGEREVAADG